MDIETTIELLNKFLTILTEDYEEEKEIYNTSKKPSEKLDCLSQLEYLQGKIDTIKLLISILKDDDKAIKTLKDFIELREFLKENKSWR